MTRLRHLFLLLIPVVLVACGGGDEDGDAPGGNASPPTAEAPAPPPDAASDVPVAGRCSLPDFRSEMLERINAARAQSRLCGTDSFPPAPALAWDEQLFAAAFGHADDMATQDYFSHDSLDGRSFSQRISAAGYQWSAVGENIAAGQASVEQVVGAWLDSPGHCANIMSRDFSEVGVACVRDDSSTYTQYWAMSLGEPR